MADIRVIKYNANGHKEEHNETTDSIKMSQFSTANHILTDTKLGNLVDGADASDEHIHDGRYFREDEHISSSAGAADAGKPVILDASGLLDNTLIDGASLSSEIDHSLLLNLTTGDPHTQYLLKTGGTMSGTLDMGTNTITNVVDPTNAQDAATKNYVDAVAEGLSAKEAARVASTANIDLTTGGLLTIDGITLVAGDRVLVKDQTTASQNGIYIAASGAWSRATDFDEVSPINEINGAYVPVQDGTENEGKFYVQSETVTALGTDAINFVFFNSATNLIGGNGINYDGVSTISVDLLLNGGLKFAGVGTDELAVEPADFAGAGLIDDGADNLAIDWSTTFDETNKAIQASDLASVSVGAGASIIGISNTTDFTATDVEGALDELYDLATAEVSPSYTAGTGGVTKGDLVYVSGDNTVLPYSNIATDEFVIGIALEDAGVGALVKVQRFDVTLAGVLTAAAAGDEYYWDGTALTATKPTGGSSNVYLAGIAINGTDLSVEVRQLYKTA